MIDSDFWFLISDFGFRISDFGFRISDFGKLGLLISAYGKSIFWFFKANFQNILRDISDLWFLGFLAKLVNFCVFEFTFVISEFQNSCSFNYLFSVSKMLVFRNKILHVDFWKRKSKLVQGEILITWFLESEIGLAANLADREWLCMIWRSCKAFTLSENHAHLLAKKDLQ